MSDVFPLGSLAAFAGFTGSRRWGPDGAWNVTFGGGRIVVEDLVAGLRAHPGHVEQKWSKKAEAYPVVLGCTPWFSDTTVADVLASMAGCVVVDKRYSRYPAAQRLATSGKGVWQGLLGLELWGPRDAAGNPPLIGPSGRLPGDRPLDPVRVLGYAADKRPLMHAKLAVCCAAWRWEGDFGEEVDHLTPLSVWMGSANWTQAAARHIEFGAWSSDKQLCQVALEFLTAVIKASEPLSSAASGPLPELTEGDFDDAAMSEYLDE
jgi:hypothetical protein